MPCTEGSVYVLPKDSGKRAEILLFGRRTEISVISSPIKAIEYQGKYYATELKRKS